jgi:hypothetical protein
MLPPRKRKQLLKKIDVAKDDVDAAEGELEKVLSEISVAPRAEKTTVSKVVEEAFGKLRSAKSDLDKLQELLSKKK